MTINTFTLTLQCNNRVGLVADVAACLSQAKANIVEAQQYNDPSNNRFYTFLKIIAFKSKNTLIQSLQAIINSYFSTT